MIEGSTNTLSAPVTQVIGGTNHQFASWSDGGAATHNITAASSATYTATYTVAPGTTSFLSDLAYTSTANGWGPVEKDRSNGEAGLGDGLPLTLNGVVYAKGLGGHAASDIRYNLAGNCSTFSVSVGLDDEVGGNGSLIFTILADGVQAVDQRGDDRHVGHPVHDPVGDRPDPAPAGPEHERIDRVRPRRLGRRQGHLRRWTAARHHAPDGHRHTPADGATGQSVPHQSDGHLQRGDDRLDHLGHDRDHRPPGTTPTLAAAVTYDPATLRARSTRPPTCAPRPPTW